MLLSSLSTLELWQDAFKCAEEIHSLLLSAKKQPKLSMMAMFYEKLAIILLVGGNVSCHATALSLNYRYATQNPKVCY